jgi:hypothetical protein
MKTPHIGYIPAAYGCPTEPRDIDYPPEAENP